MSRPIRRRRSLPPRRPEGPLTLKEMERLDDFLLRGSGDIESFHMLDGFISAIALLPDPLLFAIWYSIIFGGADDAETAAHVAAAESDGILGLLVRHWSTVVRRLTRGGEWEIPECDEETDLDLIAWALGFQEGMYHTEELRAELISEERCAAPLAPIRRLADRALITHGRPQISPAVRAELLRDLVPGVNRVYRELRKRREG